jgi:hypothetical protein
MPKNLSKIREKGKMVHHYPTYARNIKKNARFANGKRAFFRDAYSQAAR